VRGQRDEARKLLANSEDPSAARHTKRSELAISFEGVAKEWLALQAQTLAPGTISMLTSRLKSCLYPYNGSRPIASLTAQELLFALRRIEARGRRDTARTSRSRWSTFGMPSQRCEHNTMWWQTCARRWLQFDQRTSRRSRIRISSDYYCVPLMDSGHPVTALALKLAPLVFVRPGELRGAEWSGRDAPPSIGILED
jgi:hypothetical protein